MILLRKIGQFIAFICQFVNIKMQILVNICISNSRNDFTFLILSLVRRTVLGQLVATARRRLNEIASLLKLLGGGTRDRSYDV